MKPMPWFYNWLYWAGFLWFVYWCYAGVADGAQYAAALPYIVSALTPMSALWLWKRVRTGSWV